MINKSTHFFKPSVDHLICRRCGEVKNSVKHIMYPKFKEDDTKSKNLRIEQSKAEGAAKGAQIVLNSYYKVLDSMSSYIKIMQKI